MADGLVVQRARDVLSVADVGTCLVRVQRSFVARVGVARQVAEGWIGGLRTSSVAVLGGLARRYLLSPAGTYGGPFAEGVLPADSVVELVRSLRSRRTEGIWRWSPFAADGPCRSWPGATDDFTQVLEEAGEAALRRRWSKGRRVPRRGRPSGSVSR